MERRAAYFLLEHIRRDSCCDASPSPAKHCKKTSRISFILFWFFILRFELKSVAATADLVIWSDGRTKFILTDSKIMLIVSANKITCTTSCDTFASQSRAGSRVCGENGKAKTSKSNDGMWICRGRNCRGTEKMVSGPCSTPSTMYIVNDALTWKLKGECIGNARKKARAIIVHFTIWLISGEFNISHAFARLNACWIFSCEVCGSRSAPHQPPLSTAATILLRVFHLEKKTWINNKRVQRLHCVHCVGRFAYSICSARLAIATSACVCANATAI